MKNVSKVPAVFQYKTWVCSSPENNAKIFFIIHFFHQPTLIILVLALHSFHIQAVKRLLNSRYTHITGKLAGIRGRAPLSAACAACKLFQQQRLQKLRRRIRVAIGAAIDSAQVSRALCGCQYSCERPSISCAE
jgi:hypothetical protein